jgi:alkylation response protein AidB-like acyl-CoA dehydrogenase
MSFFQEPPTVRSAMSEDRALESFLRHRLPPDVFREVRPSLDAMGELSAGRLRELAMTHRLDEPQHTPFDAWGRRVDRIEVNPAWREYARVAAEHGIVATAFERRHGEYSRLHQMALAYLFAPSSQTYTCPLAMTDGCARTLELAGEAALSRDVLPRLISRDPEKAWTSGQWMTERTGGSDVGLSETVARRQADGSYRLYGTKWFTSAIASEVALTLGRPDGNGPGGKGLALFFVRVRDESGYPNGLTVLRLKDKLGTRHLPTAELLLDGAVAHALFGDRDGIRHMATMLNVTRTWNAVCSVAGMQRAIALARDYARRRVAFGAPLSEKPLHVETLADLAAEHEVLSYLTFTEVLLLGRLEAGSAPPNEKALLSVLLPVSKLLTAKSAVRVASEVLECFGGAGYVEDTGLPAMLRDAQVLPIWEGTTNVLSLETLRAFAREDAWQPVLEAVKVGVGAARDPSLVALAKAAVEALERTIGWARESAATNRGLLEAGARRFAFSVGRSLALAFAIQHAETCFAVDGDRRPIEATRRFAEAGIDFLSGQQPNLAISRSLAFCD